MLGAEKLSDQELLAILLATGSKEASALDLAEQLLQRYQGLAGLQQATLADLMEQKGIGTAKATTIAAAVELGKRISTREHFFVLFLNPKHAVLGMETVSIGTLSSSLVHPREVFKQAIKRSASAVILAHNHPSGNCEPSKEDLQVTKRLKDAGELVGIEVIDHLIIGEDRYYSFCENELL